jgi:hypothetical protein
METCRIILDFKFSPWSEYCIIFGDSPASEFYVPTFRNTLSPAMMMELTECSETSVHKIQTPGNHPKERIRVFLLLSYISLYILFFNFMCLGRSFTYLLLIYSPLSCFCVMYVPAILSTRNSLFILFLHRYSLRSWDRSIDGKIILKLILKKYDGNVLTACCVC